MKSSLWKSAVGYPLFVLLFMGFAPLVGYAQESGVSDAMFTVNNTWMLVAAFLVFIMHLGFACLESGLTQSKNTVNICVRTQLSLL